MAKSRNNVVTHGLSGKIGMLVFRQVDGETIVSTMPEQSSELTEKQLAHRKRFQRAVLYGTIAVESPETKELYETLAAKKGRKVFNVATPTVRWSKREMQRRAQAHCGYTPLRKTTKTLTEIKSSSRFPIYRETLPVMN
jgi:hypothetical protein